MVLVSGFGCEDNLGAPEGCRERETLSEIRVHFSGLGEYFGKDQEEEEEKQ